MKNTREIFADGIGEIRLLGGMVRIDLISLGLWQLPASQQLPGSKARIIMPPEGFRRSFDTMHKLIDQLEENGVVEQKKASQE